MAENILINECGDLPVVIIRPSIGNILLLPLHYYSIDSVVFIIYMFVVTAAWQSPLPGWVDNLNGPTGVITGGGKGILRTLYCPAGLRGDIIPVDICINAMIVSAWSTAKKKYFISQFILLINCMRCVLHLLLYKLQKFSIDCLSCVNWRAESNHLG